MFKINESIDYIFDTLVKAGNDSASRKKMKPARPESSEIACFKRLKFRSGESVTLLNGVKFVHFQDIKSEKDGTNFTTDYFAIKNLMPSEFSEELSDNFFSSHTLTESFFVFLCPILDLKIRGDISPQSISNELLFQQDDELYEGHSINELINYFEPITIFRLEDLSTNFHNSFLSCAYYIVSSCEKFITLPLSKENIDKLKNLFIVDGKIPKDNIFLSLTSTHLKHCFLELYRCIEWLYVIPRSRRLKGAISYSKPAYELAIHCMDELSWRRQEEDSLSKIISDILKSSETLTFKLRDCKLFNDINLDSANIAKHLYSFRNQFVHQFQAKREKNVILEDLADAIDLISDIIIHAYQLYDIDIISWQDDPTSSL